jgi:type III secretion system YscD/HrpQ family protein
MASTHTSATPSKPGWCLRFLSGAVKGRTIALKPGANLLGSGAESDVLLPGGDVLGKHLVIHVGELVVTLQRVGDAAAQLNGDALATQRRSVIAGDVVSIGAIDFQLDRSYPAAPAEDGPGDDDFPESILGAELPDRAAAAPAPRGLSRNWSVAALLLAAGTLAAFAAWNGGAGATRGAGELPELGRVLKPYPEVELLAAGSGFEVRGYVESTARRQALQQALAPFGTRVQMQVHAADQIVEQARQYLAEPGLSLNYAGQGRLVVSGTVDDPAVRRKLRRLAEDLPPAIRVSDQVQVRERPAAERAPAPAPQSTALAELQAAMPGRIVSITDHGEQGRYIQLSNGARYYEGAVLPSGAELTRIGADGLVVSGSPARPGAGAGAGDMQREGPPR